MIDIIEEFQELVQIPSPSLGERLMADALTGKLRELGLTVEEEDTGAEIGGNAGNLYAYLSPTEGISGDSILLSAHMDRVPGGDGIRCVDRGEFLSSDGTTILAADDLSGVCAILDGIRRVKESGKPHCGVEIVFTVCEENETKGAKNLWYERIRSKAGYCMDSSGRLGRVVTGAPKIDHLELKFFGKRAHAGAEPEKGADALKAAARVKAAVREGRLDPETTANLGVLHAGAATNVICDHAVILGEVRSYDAGKVSTYEEALRNLIVEATDGTGVRAEMSVIPDTEAFRVDSSDPVVRKLLSAMEKTGVKGLAENGGGGMDANTFNQKGIVSVGVATGYEKNHTKEEILYKEDLRKAGETVAALIFEWSGAQETEIREA